jgi:hypothetical protein
LKKISGKQDQSSTSFQEGCRSGKLKALKKSEEDAKKHAEYYSGKDKNNSTYNPEVPNEIKTINYYKEDPYLRGFEEAFTFQYNERFPKFYVQFYNQMNP